MGNHLNCCFTKRNCESPILWVCLFPLPIQVSSELSVFRRFSCRSSSNSCCIYTYTAVLINPCSQNTPKIDLDWFYKRARTYFNQLHLYCNLHLLCNVLCNVMNKIYLKDLKAIHRIIDLPFLPFLINCEFIAYRYTLYRRVNCSVVYCIWMRLDYYVIYVWRCS